jgi:cytochrome c peroxidase
VRPILALTLFLWAVVSIAGALVAQTRYPWSIPAGFPRPPVPADNPISEATVELGRHLFYDTRLSGNGKQACATCHEQRLAFTDGRARSVGSTGELHPRSSMSLVNVAYAATLTWANPTLTRLEEQALVPMYGDHPVELGLNRNDAWIDSLRRDPLYEPLFASAFGEDQATPTRANILKALASFQRAIVSARSPYDRYHFDRDDAAISDRATRGEVLFHSRPLSCFTCHGGFNFTGAVVTERRPANDVEFHNTGLYNLSGILSYPEPNTGAFEVTKNPKDVGKFKAPTLRNIALTAPYMHDGSAATLEDVLDHYMAGGRTIASGPHQGVGHDNPNKSPTIRGFSLTHGQRDDLIAFLRSLTDEELLGDDRFSNPWPGRSRQ